MKSSYFNYFRKRLTVLLLPLLVVALVFSVQLAFGWEPGPGDEGYYDPCLSMAQDSCDPGT